MTVYESVAAHGRPFGYRGARRYRSGNAAAAMILVTGVIVGVFTGLMMALGLGVLA